MAAEPYDDVSWELPAHYHLQAVASADPSVRSSDLINLTETPHASGRVIGSGSYYVLKDTGQEGLLEARYRLAQFNIEIAERPFSLRKIDYPAGSWIIPAQAGLADTLRDCAANLGLDFNASASVPNVPHHSAKAPRLGIWVPWADTDSIGWVRYSLDQRNVPYIYLRDEDIRAGNLHDKVDVILYGTWTWSLPSRSTASRRSGVRCRTRRLRKLPVTVRPPNPTTSQAESAWRALRRSSTSWKAVVCS